jgi:hypothetical protein
MMSRETPAQRYHTQHPAGVTQLDRMRWGRFVLIRGNDQMTGGIVIYSQIDSPALSNSIRNGEFKKNSINGILTLSGRCPRCSHEFSCSVPLRPVVVTPGSYVTGQSASGSLTANPQEHTVFCSCTQEHEGRPAGEVGCGAMTRFLLRKART